jgi:probable F420-dependent oxidoreductase
MKFGLRYCNTGRYVDPVRAIELLQAAEAAGFESAWTVEHTVVPAGYESPYPYANDGKMAGGVDDFPLPDPLIWMAYVAAATTRIKLATGILILPQHNPVVVAKQVATLDYLSGGRVLLGIGVGWLKEEFDALGASFEDRGARTDEYVHAMRALWRDPKPTFHGRFVDFQDAYCLPQPLQGTVPIIVGGHSSAAARRAGRLGDGFFPARGASAELIHLARRTAGDFDRDPDRLEITTSMPASRDEIPELAARGVHRLLVPVTAMPGLPSAISSPEDVLGWRDTLERYAD